MTTWAELLDKQFPSGPLAAPWRGELPWEYLATAALVRASFRPTATFNAAAPRVLKADCHDEHAGKPCEGGLASVLGPAVVLLELDAVVVDAMRARAAPFDIRCGSILSIPFEAGTFGLVADFSTLDHVAPAVAPTALREYFRVLRSDGILLLFVWESHDPRDLEKAACDGAQPYGPNHQFYFEVGTVQKWALAAGFETVSRSWWLMSPYRQMARYIFVKKG